jgi:hypothetical protein
MVGSASQTFGLAIRLNFSTMPIATESIPVLIKTAREQKIESWKVDYYRRIAKDLQVHTKGQLFTKVDTLFPNESPDSKAHCIATYEPITKSSIWKGINNLSRIFSNSSFSFDVGEDLSQWLQDYQHDGMGLLNYFLEMWLHKAIAEDPNGLFVVYPPDYAEENDICPIQFVRSELIRATGKLADGTQFVAFVSEHDSVVKYTMEHVCTKREVFYDDTIDRMNARTLTETTYNKRLEIKVQKGVVHLFTADGFLVYDEEQPNGEVKYTLHDFPETMSAIPIFPGGGNIADKADVPLYESFVHPFVPFGNLALLQHRNHRAVDLQFSYPRMSELQTPCDKCQGGKIKGRKTTANPTGLKNCTTCNGTGWTTVQSPYKVYSRKYDPTDEGENKHLQVKPVEFYAPDVGVINYSKDAWRDYLKMAEEAVFIMQKVYTGQVQSKESKEIDLDDMHAWLLNISRTYYGNTRHLLQALEEYMSASPVTVSVEKPYSFAILTEEMAFVVLTDILASDAPVYVKANRVEDFVHKFVSKNSPIVRALAILKQYDTLLFYNTKEIQTFKAAGTITQEMWTNHILAYPVLVQLFNVDPTLFDQTDAVIITKLDAQIKAMNIPAPGSTFRSAIQQQLQQPITTPAA